MHLKVTRNTYENFSSIPAPESESHPLLQKILYGFSGILFDNEWKGFCSQGNWETSRWGPGDKKENEFGWEQNEAFGGRGKQIEQFVPWGEKIALEKRARLS